MQNIILAWQNRADEAALSGGAWQATLPLANLKNRQVQKVARTANVLLASTKFDIDLGQTRNIGVVSLIVHNISVSGLVRIRGATDAAFTDTIYDSGWINAWPSGIIPQNLLEWEDDNFWLGTLSQQARAGYQSPYTHLLSAATIARYWRVEIDDTTNSDGYVHIGRLFLSGTWAPTYNYSYGAELSYEDPTPIETSLSGAEYFDVRSRNRVFRFELGWLSSDEAYSRSLELQRLAGVSGEVLAIPDSTDTVNQTRRSYVGRLKTLGKIANPKFNSYANGFELKELL